MWSAEAVANTFIGPPIGSLLLIAMFSLPFFVDAASFFLAAALVALIPGIFRAERPEDSAPSSWRSELAEGVKWLWHNPLLRSMAIILGLMNMANTLSGAMLVLFAQDVLHVTPITFTLMGFGFAVGGIVGGYAAPWMSKKFGSGTCLSITLGSMAVMQLLVGLSSWWPLVAVLFAVGTLLGSTWNVITVSLRQTIIPPHLLGRVNSVYRFFAWGMMPIGAALGGLVVIVAERYTSHTMALRWVWFVDAAIGVGLFVVGRRLLTTERLEAARAAAIQPPALTFVGVPSATLIEAHPSDVVQAIVSDMAGVKGGLLPALQAVQHEMGYIDLGVVALLAEAFNVSSAEVHGVVSFYSDLRTTPPTEPLMRVCRGDACQARGGRRCGRRPRISSASKSSRSSVSVFVPRARLWPWRITFTHLCRQPAWTGLATGTTIAGISSSSQARSCRQRRRRPRRGY